MKKFFAITAFLMIFFSSFTGMKQTSSFSFTLEAIPECGYIQLKWEAVTGADRYYIYRGPGVGMEYDTPLTDFPIEETNYKDVTDLVVNQQYCYIVKAVNQDGREFLDSTEACATFTCKEEVPPIDDSDCKLVLKYQVGNYYYWRNENQKGPMDVEPVLLNSRVLASARYLAEEVGAVVSWDGTTRTVKIVTLDGVVIQMQIGNPIMMVNGNQVQIDPNNKAVTPIIYKNRTMLPFRALAYNLGATGPDDIVWLGDIKTAVLTFNDGNCNWICGCYKSSFSPAGDLATLQFYEGCSDTNKQNIQIPSEMKDKLHGWLLREYVQNYLTKGKWCVEIRLDKDNTVIAWRARPDQYPDCCQSDEEEAWVCGCMKLHSQSPFHNASEYAFYQNCGQNQPITALIPVNMKDIQLGMTAYEYAQKFPNQYEWCVEAKLDKDSKIVVWKATPEKYPSCCEGGSPGGTIQEFYGSILSASLVNSHYRIVFSTWPDHSNEIILTMKEDILDKKYNYKMVDYINRHPNQKFWCAILKINQNNEVIEWESQTDRYPDCCQTKKGQIKITMPEKCFQTTDIPRIEIYHHAIDSRTDQVRNTEPLLVIPSPKNKVWDTGCTLPYNQYYWIKPVSSKCTYEPPIQKVYLSCCPETTEVEFTCQCEPDYSRIWVELPENCVQGTTVKIYEGNAVNEKQLVTVLTPDKDGRLTTECKLKCNAVYTVQPLKENCQFLPETRTVTTQCCPLYATVVSFHCTCGTDNARIKIKIPEECVKGTEIDIYEGDQILNKRPLVTITPDSSGNYDTGCKLQCNTIYTVVPRNEWCKFAPSSYEVKTKCCPDSSEVTFTKDGEPELGRIIISIDDLCFDSFAFPYVLIYDEEPTTTSSPIKIMFSYEKKEFDTECTLSCGKTYWVYPYQMNHTFEPAFQKVTPPCCPDSAKVSFKCEPKKSAHMKINLPLSCCDGTIIHVYHGADYDENSSKTILSTHQDGDFGWNYYFSCNSTLTIVPINANFHFYPEKITVTPSCLPTIDEVNFKCEDGEARLQIRLPPDCSANTTVKIFEGDQWPNGKPSMTLIPNSEGLCDTKCSLKCNTYYTVKPENKLCAFSPAYRSITVSCCPALLTISFEKFSEGIGSNSEGASVTSEDSDRGKKYKRKNVPIGVVDPIKPFGVKGNAPYHSPLFNDTNGYKFNVYAHLGSPDNPIVEVGDIRLSDCIVPPKDGSIGFGTTYKKGSVVKPGNKDIGDSFNYSFNKHQSYRSQIIVWDNEWGRGIYLDVNNNSVNPYSSTLPTGQSRPGTGDIRLVKNYWKMVPYSYGSPPSPLDWYFSQFGPVTHPAGEAVLPFYYPYPTGYYYDDEGNIKYYPKYGNTFDNWEYDNGYGCVYAWYQWGYYPGYMRWSCTFFKGVSITTDDQVYINISPESESVKIGDYRVN